jgi:hypothetical protein
MSRKKLASVLPWREMVESIQYPVFDRKLWKAVAKELSNSATVLAMFAPQ